MQEILQSTPKYIDQVTIEPDGNWSKDVQPAKPTGASAYGHSDSDDDIIEISTSRPNTRIKAESPNTPQSMSLTPLAIGDSITNSGGGHRGQKRQSEVIDLTLSSDDETIRSNKRQVPNSRPYHSQVNSNSTAFPTNQFPTNTSPLSTSYRASLPVSFSFSSNGLPGRTGNPSNPPDPNNSSTNQNRLKNFFSNPFNGNSNDLRFPSSNDQTGDYDSHQSGRSDWSRSSFNQPRFS